jgi:hypothetical protein
MAAFGAIGAVLMATGPRIAAERQSGWLRQLRLTPLRPGATLAARLVAALALTLPAICLKLRPTVAELRLAGVVGSPAWSCLQLELHPSGRSWHGSSRRSRCHPQHRQGDLIRPGDRALPSSRRSDLGRRLVGNSTHTGVALVANGTGGRSMRGEGRQ